MDLNLLGIQICKQAEEKGWGHTKENLVVPEKMMLISAEITELRDARNSKTAKPKDTKLSEYADVLTRTLHLGTAWGIDFNKKVKYSSKIRSRVGEFELLDLLYLHDLVSKGYEHYRKKRIALFKKYLYLIAYETVLLSQMEEVDIEMGALNKININMTRVWSSKKMNENLYK